MEIYSVLSSFSISAPKYGMPNYSSNFKKENAECEDRNERTQGLIISQLSCANFIEKEIRNYFMIFSLGLVLRRFSIILLLKSTKCHSKALLKPSFTAQVDQEKVGQVHAGESQDKRNFFAVVFKAKKLSSQIKKPRISSFASCY